MNLADVAERLELDTPFGAQLADQVVDLAHDALLQVGDDGVDLLAQLGLAGDDLGDLGVERRDVDGLARVLCLDVGRDRDVVAVLGEVGVRDELREVVDVLAGGEGIEDLLLVRLGELVLVARRGRTRRTRR